MWEWWGSLPRELCQAKRPSQPALQARPFAWLLWVRAAQEEAEGRKAPRSPPPDGVGMAPRLHLRGSGGEADSSTALRRGGGEGVSPVRDGELPHWAAPPSLWLSSLLTAGFSAAGSSGRLDPGISERKSVLQCAADQTRWWYFKNPSWRTKDKAAAPPWLSPQTVATVSELFATPRGWGGGTPWAHHAASPKYGLLTAPEGWNSRRGSSQLYESAPEPVNQATAESMEIREYFKYTHHLDLFRQRDVVSYS